MKVLMQNLAGDKCFQNKLALWDRGNVLRPKNAGLYLLFRIIGVSHGGQYRQ